MSKIKRFIDCYIPTETCNLRCHYCYIAQKRKFNNKLAHFSHSIDEIKKAFSFERMGGICLINICAGGETLLSEEVVGVVEALIQVGHYVMIVTNGTLTNRFREISCLPKSIRSHLFIKFSLHYLEMIRLGWLDRFAENVRLMKKSGVSFTVEVTPSDELIPLIPDLKTYCIENFGALCHITIARDDRTGGIDVLSDLDYEAYKRTWSQFDSEMFMFKTEIFYKKRTEFCYAGDWSIYLNLETGDIRQCYCGKIIGTLYDFTHPIAFEAIGSNCSYPHCYNGHAFLTLGDIPEINTTTYDKTRNRICIDGSEWLQPEMKEIMSSRLQETNKEYVSIKKFLINKRFVGKKTLKEYKRKIKRVIKNVAT